MSLLTRFDFQQQRILFYRLMKLQASTMQTRLLPSATQPVSTALASTSANVPKFQAGLKLSPMGSLFSFFESSYQPGFIALSKVIANTMPRVAITRSASERKEVLFNEVTQGATLFVLLAALSPIGNHIQSWFSGKDISKAMIKAENTTAIKEALQSGGEMLANRLKVAKLGKSIGASLFIASTLIATTYLRNYRTIKRTGFSDYKKIVGLEGDIQPTPEDKVKADKAAKKNLNIIKGLMAGGTALWIGTMGAFGLMAKRGNPKLFSESGVFKPDRLANWMKHWSFVGKNSNQINGLFNSKKQTLWVWGIPSFAGWFLGCRDKYELVEQTSKFATFWAGYIGTPMFINKVFKGKEGSLLENLKNSAENTTLEKLPATYNAVKEKVASGQMTEAVGKQIERAKNNKWYSLTGLNFLIAGVLPLVFNIGFSKWRHQREMANKAITTPTLPNPQVNTPGMFQSLQRKSFNQFVHTSWIVY